MNGIRLNRLTDYLYEIPMTGAMRVPGRIYASAKLMESQKADESLQQVANVATLPGIVKYSMAMPDFHWGYGFPIGGVAAFDVDDGIISPGGVGYDINCGVRLMRTGLVLDDVRENLREITRAIYRDVPAGVGSSGAIEKLTSEDFRALIATGARWAVERGYGAADNLSAIEDEGCMAGADPDAVGHRAFERGIKQIGTLGSGNHFLEIQVIDEVFLPDIAERFGLRKGGIAVAIHSGSRGFGHQICEDHLTVMVKAAKRYGIDLVDRQLACAPTQSAEGQRYLVAMACAANFAWVNRQVMMHLTERAIARAMKASTAALDMRLIYDVCHNIAKFEEHIVDGVKRRVCVHRKGATRAFGPGHPLIHERYRESGQPVLVPGDMGRSSYLCLGTQKAMEETFGSACHGAGRRHSRKHMLKEMAGRNLFREMENRGVIVMAQGAPSVAEEMPEAYKDVSDVVDVMQSAGIARKLIRLRPIACVKG